MDGGPPATWVTTIQWLLFFVILIWIIKKWNRSDYFRDPEIRVIYIIMGLILACMITCQQLASMRTMLYIDNNPIPTEISNQGIDYLKYSTTFYQEMRWVNHEVKYNDNIKSWVNHDPSRENVGIYTNK